MTQSISLSTLPHWLRKPDLVGQREVTPAQAERNRARGKGKVKPCPRKKGILPMSDATLYRLILRGEFPAPVHLSERLSAWETSKVLEWMDGKYKQHP